MKQDTFFDKDFYPTPVEVIETMIFNQDIKNKIVLEPSAGKGNIVDYLNDLGCKVLSCEKNNDLAEIVKGKSKFLKNDFLDVTSDEVSHIDFIIMNPPFSQDVKHILHAWDIAPKGCAVISLCNWETIDNYYSGERRILRQVISNNGTSQNLGNCFTESERKTGVEVGLVKLYKVGSKTNFDDYFDMGEDDFGAQENALMSYNVVRDVVERYVGSIKLYDEVLENAVRMNEMAGILGVKSVSFTCNVDEKPSKKEDFIKGLQKSAWQWIFGKMNMQKFMTQSLKEELNNFVETQTKVPFTMKNIYKMMDLVFQTHGQRMDRALIEVFDKLTSHYDENRYSLEGWKTNSHYLINKKFILPYICEVGYHGELGVKYSGYNSNTEKIDDMIKALCHLTGKDITTSESLYSAFRTEKGKEPKRFNTWYDYEFFDVKGFKKGTMHFKFKDDNIWALFNRRVAEIKGFPLPEKL